MGRETILESLPPFYISRTGTITVTAGSKNVVGVGTTFTSESFIGPGRPISYTDDAGVTRFGIVDSITDDTNLVLVLNALSTATGVSFKGGELRSPYFIGDNTRLKSALVDPGTNDGGGPFTNQRYLTTSFDGKSISADEGVLIKTIYFRLPFQYTMADSRIGITLYYCDPGNSSIKLGNIDSMGEGDGSGIFVPGENGEIEVNAYVPPPETLGSGGEWAIAYDIVASWPDADIDLSDNSDIPSISQVDAPDSLNGVILPCYVGARILHAKEPIIV